MKIWAKIKKLNPFVWVAFYVILMLLVLKLGAYIAYQESKANNFVGIVGNNTHVDNSSDKEMTDNDLETFWYLTNKGAPGPFLLLGRIFTRRIEVIDFHFPKNEKLCGCVDSAKYYTFFNIKYLDGGGCLFCP